MTTSRWTALRAVAYLANTLLNVEESVQDNHVLVCTFAKCLKGKRSPYSITERKVPELIQVIGSQVT